jgi:GH35 family endo-1,4-beta-xylanase
MRRICSVRARGAACLLILLSSLVAAAADSEASGPKQSSDWRAEAESRIRKHRKGDFVVRVLLPNREPAGGRSLQVRQTRNQFLFGTAINAWGIHRAGAGYRDFVKKHCSVVVPEDAMKWYCTERRKGRVRYRRADRLVRFAEENALALRGHCLFWSRRKFVQSWVKELPADELRRRTEARIKELVGRYKGRVPAWDVNNEMLNGSFYKDRLGADIRAEMFKQAHAVDPEAALYVNEYAVLGNEEKTTQYLELLTDLQKRGAPVGGIGIQEHACERFVMEYDRENPPEEEREYYDGPLTPEEALATLERFARAQPDLPIHLTEVSCKDPDPVRRGEGLATLFTLAFSHPQVEAILLWGFHEHIHWLGSDAILMQRDGSLNAAGQRLSDLLLRQWRTSLDDVVLPKDGVLRFRGFYGTYEILMRDEEGRRYKAEITLTRSTDECEAVLSPVDATR